jgi:hypothetical protein
MWGGSSFPWAVGLSIVRRRTFAHPVTGMGHFRTSLANFITSAFQSKADIRRASAMSDQRRQLDTDSDQHPHFDELM